jgi:hypothetical protein
VTEDGDIVGRLYYFRKSDSYFSNLIVLDIDRQARWRASGTNESQQHKGFEPTLSVAGIRKVEDRCHRRAIEL